MVAEHSAPTITAAVKGLENTVDIIWAGPPLATVDVLLYNTNSTGWQEAPDQPVTPTGANTGTVPLGGTLAWASGANYLLLTGTTAGTETVDPIVGFRSRLFVIRLP